MEWLGLLGSQAVNSWAAGGRRRQYKVEAKSRVSLGVVHPLLPRLRLCEVAFGSFQGFPEADRGGRGGVGHNGRFQNTQILCSFQLVWVTRQGWWCVTKCKFQPQYWSIMGGGGPWGKWPRRYQAEDGDISSEKRRMGRTDGKIGEYFLRG